NHLAHRPLRPDAAHPPASAVDDYLALERHTSQLVVALAGLDLQARARVSLEVAHLLGARIGPRPDPGDGVVLGRLAQHVPQRHQVWPAARSERRAGDGALPREERAHLRVAHPDLLPPAHGGEPGTRAAD